MNEGTAVIIQEYNSFHIYMIKDNKCIIHSNRYDLRDCVRYLEFLENQYKRVLFDTRIGVRNTIVNATNKIGVEYKVISPAGIRQIKDEVKYEENDRILLIAYIINYYKFTIDVLWGGGWNEY